MHENIKFSWKYRFYCDHSTSMHDTRPIQFRSPSSHSHVSMNDTIRYLCAYCCILFLAPCTRYHVLHRQQTNSGNRNPNRIIVNQIGYVWIVHRIQDSGHGYNRIFMAKYEQAICYIFFIPSCFFSIPSNISFQTTY